jgi:hypothetical protein
MNPALPMDYGGCIHVLKLMKNPVEEGIRSFNLAKICRNLEQTNWRPCRDHIDYVVSPNRSGSRLRTRLPSRSRIPWFRGRQQTAHSVVKSSDRHRQFC